MRKLAIAVALVSTAMATPAVARDRSFYAGVEGGVMFVEDMDFDYDDDTPLFIADALTSRHNVGFDVDVIAGYDFGMIRLEGELAYKRARVHEISASALLSG
ncbi:MAG: OmpA family protein, partial [Gammaproteobacteria bacterium]